MKFPRFTIERLRTVVLIGGGILVVAIAVFLIAGQWKLHKLVKDLPGKLGVDIQQSANGIDYTQSRKGKTLFKLHAARAVQIKSTGKSLLHDVHIDLYGEDGTRADTISGSEFEYDPAAGIAHAAGTVEITMMRPGARPAIAQLKPQFKPEVKSESKPSPAPASPSALTANTAITDNEIHVTTSGLVFNQKTGVATTDQRVDFAVRQGKGDAIGATYNSQAGQLVLDHAVELVANSSATGSRGAVTVHAAHAEFQRTEQLCILNKAQAQYSGGSAEAALARLRFREDGTVEQMQGSGGVDLHSASGAHVSAPQGVMVFDEDNHPRTADLTGGTRLAMQTVTGSPANGAGNPQNREVDGSAPSAHLVFDGKGELHQAHLERGVLFHTHQKGTSAKGGIVESSRTWSSTVADVDFAHRDTEADQHGSGKSSAGQTEPRTIHGSGGVTVTSETISNGRTAPAKLSADDVVAELAPGSVLTHLIGSGHAYFEQQTAQGARQTSSSDQLDVHFARASSVKPMSPPANPPRPSSQAGAPAVEIEAMHQSGHVVLTQMPAPSKAGSQPEQAPMRATADSSDYDGRTETLHLSGSPQSGPPRVQQGALDLTAQSIDFTRSTGDALAHGDVRASWSNNGAQKAGALPGATLLAGAPGGSDARNNGPVHAIAAEAELRQSTQEIFLRAAPGSVIQGNTSGNAPQARLWQAGNSVSAPLIILNRQKMTLVAQTASTTNPVRTVLLGNAPAAKNGAAINSADHRSSASSAGAKSPSTIRMRSGDLRYSEGERLAVFHGGVLGNVIAETAENGSPATITAQQAEVHLTPAGAHGAAGASGNASVERMTAQGRVNVDFPDRHGTGDRLVYLAEDGTFTLIGTGANPPRMTDSERGSVTGAALVYHSRDRSVTVEGQGAKTGAETRAPK